jgi:glycine cleavage system regulatory protein
MLLHGSSYRETFRKVRDGKNIVKKMTEFLPEEKMKKMNILSLSSTSEAAVDESTRFKYHMACFIVSLSP